MRIAMIASEAAPFIKTGGLGDVLQALPAELVRIPGNEISLFLPYYKKIKYASGLEPELITSFNVNLTWRQQYVGIFRMKEPVNGVDVYFIDNEFYFCRDGIYGFYDDGERFAFYAKAVLAAMDRINLRPDVMHCHDWQTALVPIFLEAEYRERFPKAKTVFTIHNVEYQGKTGPEFFNEVLGLDDAWRGICTFDGCINFMKAAIVKADLVTTVSETYAKELRYPYFAHGLSGMLASRGDRLCGITNGIDVTVYDPASDKALVRNYSAERFSDKLVCKRALQREQPFLRRAQPFQMRAWERRPQDEPFPNALLLTLPFSAPPRVCWRTWLQTLCRRQCALCVPPRFSWRFPPATYRVFSTGRESSRSIPLV